MSSIILGSERREERTETSVTIVELFQAYCDHIYGNDKWEELMEVQAFNDMINSYYPTYGDLIFSTIADILAESEDIPIKDLLQEFSNFIRSYY